MDRANRLNWLIFLALGVMWGSSYLFIKIGIETLTPLTLVALRLAVGGALLTGLVLLAREPMPRRVATYGHLVVMSIFNIVLPFTLITWAELTVASSLAAILTATVPLFVIVIAAVALRDEPITVGRVAGLILGFAGVVMLTGGGTSEPGSLVAQLALIGAAISYAIGAVYARRNVKGLRPMVPAMLQVTIAFAISAGLALVFERPFSLSYPPQAIASVLWIGLLGSGLAYLAFFRLLATWGATRTSMVAYVLPAVGIVLGVAFAGEAIDARIIGGSLMIAGGIGLVNARITLRRLAGALRRAKEVPA
ncbi:MAG: EamA family transporter [Candidatus Limnocylindria bacterium]